MAEIERLASVRKFLELDFDKSKEFKEITDLATQLCDKPISLITLLDEDINWIKVSTGINIKQSPRKTSFCQYAVNDDELTVIPDAMKDQRFDDNPLVHSEESVRFYAGAPLILTNGERVGSLCLFDTKPNNLTALQKKTLVTLSRQVTYLMELEMNKLELLDHIEEIKLKNESLQAIAQMQSHEIRQPLSSIIGLVNLVKGGYSIDNEWLEMLDNASSMLDQRIHAIVNETMGNKDLKVQQNG